MPISAALAAPARYDRVARALHWSIAALILAAFALGLTVDAFPKTWKYAVTELHKVIGVTILLLVLLRVAWRLGHPVGAAAELSGGMRRAAAAGHAGLYLLMLAVPAIGIAFSLLRGQGLDFGFAAIPPLMEAAARTVSRPVKEVHELAAYALIALAGLHALAALWHHLVLRDSVLRRMLPEH